MRFVSCSQSWARLIAGSTVTQGLFCAPAGPQRALWFPSTSHSIRASWQNSERHWEHTYWLVSRVPYKTTFTLHCCIALQDSRGKLEVVTWCFVSIMQFVIKLCCRGSQTCLLLSVLAVNIKYAHFCFLQSTKIHYRVKLHQNLTNSFQGMCSFLIEKNTW